MLPSTEIDNKEEKKEIEVFFGRTKVCVTPRTTTEVLLAAILKQLSAIYFELKAKK